jgi:threonyl-tRNA synthetase
MVHRAIFGSLERFIGMLTEQFAGEFPLWLAPVQVAVLPVNEQVLGYAKEVDAKLKAAGIRSEVDARAEKIGRKIRDSELEKVEWMAIIGEREHEAQGVSVRRHGKGDLGPQSLDLLDEIEDKR